MSANDVVPIFKLADLLQLYTDRLIELGVDITGRIHSTYLKKIEYSQMYLVSILTNKVEMSYRASTMMLDMHCVMRV